MALEISAPGQAVRPGDRMLRIERIRRILRHGARAPLATRRDFLMERPPGKPVAASRAAVPNEIVRAR